MRILVVTSDVPRRRHDEAGVAAVHIVAYALLRTLLDAGHEIVLQIIFNVYRTGTELAPGEARAIDDLREQGVRVLELLGPRDYAASAARAGRGPLDWPARLLRWWRGAVPIERFYPAIALRATMEERIADAKADAVLTIWSPEGVAATHGLHRTPRIAYHGDVDFEPARARIDDRALFSPAAEGSLASRVARRLRAIQDRFWLAEFRCAHLRLMDDLDVVANVAACNAEYYARHLGSKAVYIRNTWLDPRNARGTPRVPASTAGGGRGPVNIIGHVGRLGATGSTLGLKFLLVDLLPELERAMHGLDYRIQVIGAGEVVPALRRHLRHERVVVRGFVEDLDAELLGSDLFLLLNNAGSYRAAYTRHIVAWSMGLCLVSHANSRMAIPEIAPMENALVGDSPQTVARMVYLGASDATLNRRVRDGGRSTYERYFSPAAVGGELNRLISGIVAARS